MLVERICSLFVYDMTNFNLLRHLPNLAEVKKPSDVTSCQVNRCLYVSDYRGPGCIIVKIQPEVDRTTSWTVAGDYGRLSVSLEGNVIVASQKSCKLLEYSSDGEHLRDIKVGTCGQVSSLWHAVKLCSDMFLIGHGREGSNVVSLVDTTGLIIQSFSVGGPSDEYPSPMHLSIDRQVGLVYVLDQNPGRISLFEWNGGASVVFVKTLTDKQDCHGRLSWPVKIVVHADRLFVADNKVRHVEMKEGRVVVFDVVCVNKSWPAQIVTYTLTLGALHIRKTYISHLNGSFLTHMHFCY